MRIEAAQLLEQHLIVVLYVVAVGRHRKEQHSVTLNVAQKAQTQAAPLAGTLNDARNIGHHKRFVAAIGHDAQTRLHGGEGVIGNLGLCRRHRAEQRRLTRVGEAHKTHISQQLQL